MSEIANHSERYNELLAWLNAMSTSANMPPPENCPQWKEIADQVLEIIQEAHTQLSSQGPDNFMQSALYWKLKALDSHASELMTASYPPEAPEIQRGRKIIDGGRKGHELEHGTAEQKQARWSKYQEALEKLLRKEPKLKLGVARQCVAEHFEVSEKTIQRHTHDPRQ